MLRNRPPKTQQQQAPILNEVLSLNAQELHNEPANRLVMHDSSMKS